MAVSLQGVTWPLSTEHLHSLIGIYICLSLFFFDQLTFLPRDVVMVAINYRLGPLGFYSLGDEKVLKLI